MTYGHCAQEGGRARRRFGSPVLLHAVTYPFPTYPFPVDGAPPGREAPITSSGDMPDNRPSVPRRLAADGGGPQ
jgi:hypothetical protein